LGVLFTAKAGCPLVLQSRGRIPPANKTWVDRPCLDIAVSALSATYIHAASSRIHLRSPFRSPPSPVAAWGWPLPWTFPSASDPAVTSDALEGGGGPGHWTRGLHRLTPFERLSCRASFIMVVYKQSLVNPWLILREPEEERRSGTRWTVR
jgi:hypothetical protein